MLELLTKHPTHSVAWDGEGAVWFVRGCCAFFTVMSALRLAKFNVLTEEIGSKLFLGIPTTLVGAVVASFLLASWEYGPKFIPSGLVSMLPYFMVALGLWMVSNIPLPKMRKTSSGPYNIWLGVNGLAAYILVPLQLCPGYLLFLSVGYAVLGSIYAVFFMQDALPELGGTAVQEGSDGG